MITSGFRSLAAYKKSFTLAISISKMASTFPKTERYSLADQIRRSSRSVSANIGEAYGRRNYPKHFMAKIADCISENYETQIWLDFALAEQYISQEVYLQYLKASEEVGRILSYMIKNPGKFCK